MKNSHWAVGLAATMTLAASGACFADVGILDGQDWASGFHSTRSRADVRNEYVDAKAHGLLPRPDGERWAPEASYSDIGARGPAGSRYQMRTREEVLDELREHRRTYQPGGPDDLYFGG